MIEPLLQVQMPDGTHAMTPKNLLDELTYSSYKHNRQMSPKVDPAQWEIVYGSQIAHLEARYQQEVSKACLPSSK